MSRTYGMTRRAVAASDPILRFWPLVLALSLLVAPGLARAAEGQARTEEIGGPDSEEEQGEYRIGAEDVLMISVREDPALTGPVTVRPDGKIGIDLIKEDLLAAGKTTRELEDEITEKLKEFIESPTVRVIVISVNSFKIYLLGEVNSQGVIQVGSRIRILQALAHAGGFTQFAERGNLLLVRENNGREVRRTFNYKKIEAGEAENFFLRPGDTIIVR